MTLSTACLIPLRMAVVLAVLPALGACVTTADNPGAGQAGPVGQATRPVATTPPRTNPVVTSSGFRAAPVMNIPGLEGVIGQNATALERVFGPPRLNGVEGDVRKLQFSGEACVLDVYLYPPRPGGEPQATYVDARRSSDGLDVDRAACVAALKRQ